jgi:hypothetical protein
MEHLQEDARVVVAIAVALTDGQSHSPDLEDMFQEKITKLMGDHAGNIEEMINILSLGT